MPADPSHPTDPGGRGTQSSWGDAVSLCIGTLTVLPVPPPMVDRVSAGRAMALAPIAGLGLGIIAAGMTFVVRTINVGSGLTTSVNILAATLAIGTLALLTRGLHLDGLADSVDGLGSGRHAPEALAIMKKSDVGPFGVLAMLFAILIQIAALTVSLENHHGSSVLVVALVTSRLVIPLACTRVPAASPTGLGALVARSVSPVLAALSIGLAVNISLVAMLLDPESTRTSMAVVGLACLAGLGSAAAFVRHCLRRFGGITGDVLGATVEITLTCALVIAAFA